jgi:hypothetical protein
MSEWVLYRVTHEELRTFIGPKIIVLSLYSVLAVMHGVYDSKTH